MQNVKLTDYNIQNFKKLADALLETESIDYKFDMSQFIGEYFEGPDNCGTVCCALGLSAYKQIVPITALDLYRENLTPSYANVDFERYYRHHFCADYKNSTSIGPVFTWCFCGYWAESYFSEQVDAAYRILYMLDGYEPHSMDLTFDTIYAPQIDMERFVEWVMENHDPEYLKKLVNRKPAMQKFVSPAFCAYDPDVHLTNLTHGRDSFAVDVDHFLVGE